MWNQCTVNEKVYTVSLFSIALVMWLVVRWGDDEPGPHRDRWLVLIAYVLALTSTNHLMGLLAVPALVVYVLWTDWRVITRPTVLVGIVIVAILGISLNYLWLPMRAGQYPRSTRGSPSGFFSQALKDVLNRVQYGKPGLGERQASFRASSGTSGSTTPGSSPATGAGSPTWPRRIFTVLGLSGLLALWKSDRRAGLAGLALLGTLSLGLVFYMNFKYGFSQYPDQPSLPREVRERDYFFIGSFAVFGAFVACGLGALMQSIVDGLRDRGTAAARWAAASPVLATRLRATRRQPRHREPRARDDGPRLRLRHPQQRGAVRRPHHGRRQRHLPALVRAGGRGHPAGRHPRQPVAHEHRVAPAPAGPPGDAGLRPGAGGSDLAERAGPAAAETPALALTQAEVDSLPEAMQVPQSGGIAFDSLQIRFGQDVLLRQDLATIFLIRDNQGKRPIYFSWSDGGYPDQTLGLSPYLVSQGFVRKLMPKPVEPTDAVKLSPGLGFVEVPRTHTLLTKVYHWRTATRLRPFGWVDAPSGSILQLYAVVYGGSARVFEQEGDTALAVLADSVAREVNRELTGRAIF